MTETALVDEKLLKMRNQRSSFKTKFEELKIDDSKSFLNYLRMSPNLFDFLLQKVKPFIKKENTIMCESIDSGARLELTLRWLACGGTFTALQYTTRISRSSINKIIIETCDALYKVLKDVNLKVSQWDQYHCMRNFQSGIS